MTSDNFDEPVTLPEPIIAWQPRHDHRRPSLLSPEAGLVLIAGAAVLGLLALGVMGLNGTLARGFDLSRRRA